MTYRHSDTGDQMSFDSKEDADKYLEEWENDEDGTPEIVEK